MTDAAGRPETSVREFSARVAGEIARGDLNSALERITDLVMQVIFHPSSAARIFSAPELDRLCTGIGALAREEAGPRLPASDVPREDRVVYLVTRLAKAGGHTRVIADLIAAQRETRSVILVSGVHESTDVEDIAALFSDAATIELAPPGDLLSRLRWIQHRLAHIRPRRTYLLNHNYDAVLVAAAQPDLVGKLVYIHHGDHMLALGVHIPHARHVDFHALGFYQCREREGVEGNILWPLVVADQGHRLNAPFLQRGHLTTCTSGRPDKFEFRQGFDLVPYLYRYDEVVPRIIGASGGTHIHIGELPGPMLERIRGGLAAAGLPSERFVHIEYVASLWRAFLDLGVDAYIGSFPFGGGRTIAEAMGAGLPLIVHANYCSPFLSSEPHVYDGAMIWRQPSELTSILSKLDLSQLTAHAHRSRAFYEAHHRAELLRRALAAEDAGEEPPPPARPVGATNPLQDYLNERAAFLTESGRRAEEARAQFELALQAQTERLHTEFERELQAQTERLHTEFERELQAQTERLRFEVGRELERDRQARDERWQAEVERTREEAIRFMTIPVRVKRVLARIFRRLLSVVPERLRFSRPPP
jgi:hypothetical protein